MYYINVFYITIIAPINFIKMPRLQILSIFCVLSTLASVFAQNKKEVTRDAKTQTFYKNLDKSIQRFEIEDIREADSNVIRIWNGFKVQTIKDNELDIVQVYHEIDSKKDFLFKLQLKVDSTLNMTSEMLKNYEAIYPLDCSSTTIEMVENGTYYLKSVGCNNEVSATTSKLNKNIIYHSEIAHFVNQLPSGNYLFGKHTKFINKPLDDSIPKSKLYKEVESKLAHVGILPSDNIFKQPAIFLDDKQITYQELNTVLYSKIIKTTLVPADMKGDYPGGIMLHTK